VAAVLVAFDRSTEEVLDAVLAEQPDVRRSLAEAWDAAWAAADPVALELCRLRVAMLLGCDAELATRTPAAVAAGLEERAVADLARWTTSPAIGPTARACLAFTEQWVVDVAGMDDATAGAVRDQVGDQGLADFASALLVIEQRQRLRLAWAVLFGGGHG
jgi:alkylhydroperoxidase family enzyme